MSDEAPEVLAEVPAPEQTETASAETEVTSAPEQEPNEAPKTFTQEELDAAIGKRLAREQRKWEREQAQRMQEQVKPVTAPDAEIRLENFNTPEEYAEALAERKAAQKLAEREQHARHSETLAAFHDREEEARNKYDDFDQVAYNPRLPITPVMAETIQASEVGPDLAYFLGSNPKEADRIARLSPFLQAKEIGRIEAKLAADPPAAKKTTAAPAPIAPVTPRSSSTPSYDTTDPRSVKTMSTSEWIAAERERQRKKLAARNR